MQYKNWLFGKDGALFRAASQGNLETVEHLITQGANVNAQSSNGYTPLLRAAQNGHKAVVEYLLTQKANPDAKSASDETPLTIAESNGHTDIANCLRQANSQT